MLTSGLDFVESYQITKINVVAEHPTNCECTDIFKTRNMFLILQTDHQVHLCIVTDETTKVISSSIDQLTTYIVNCLKLAALHFKKPHFLGELPMNLIHPLTLIMDTIV